jgi:negative regulator of sigma-B (phosphoserine phosphatase)
MNAPDPRLTISKPILESGWAATPFKEESGDLHLIAASPQGALVAVIDGLGHGAEAAFAARSAAGIIAAHAHEPVQDLVQRCHAGLRKTRGVAMSIASFGYGSSTFTWLGIGNVEAVLFRDQIGATKRQENLRTLNGIVGDRLPPLRANIVAIAPGNLLVMGTDGLRSGFADDLVDHVRQPQVIAGAILARYGTGSDDALVVVARYLHGEVP